MAVTKRTRYEVLKRDNHTCRYCGASAPDAKLTVDHVVPVALGGSDDPSNLVTACVDCNAGKASTAPDAVTIEDVKQLDLRWASAIERAAEVMAVQREKREDYVMTFLTKWERYGRTPAYDLDSVARLYEAGLPLDEMIDAADSAIFARGIFDRFAYFMGIGWRKVRQIQETAKQILEAEES
jgi:hypothetical protein